MADIYEPGSYEPTKAVGYLMHRVRSEILAGMDKEFQADEQLAAMELTSAQFVVLGTLSMGHAKSASHLCKGISYDAGAMTRMLDRLEEKGLLRRTRDLNDRRQVQLELTEKCVEALPRMKAASMRVVNRFLQGFSKAEARQLEGFLMRMMENAPREA